MYLSLRKLRWTPLWQTPLYIKYDLRHGQNRAILEPYQLFKEDHLREVINLRNTILWWWLYRYWVRRETRWFNKAPNDPTHYTRSTFWYSTNKMAFWLTPRNTTQTDENRIIHQEDADQVRQKMTTNESTDSGRVVNRIEPPTTADRGWKHHTVIRPVAWWG